MSDEKQTEQMELAKSEEQNQVTYPDAPPSGDLVAMAISQDLDVEKLRALIDMKNEQEAREAKRAYDRHFAEMQAEFDTAHRTKKGYDYRYAPIEELQKQYGPIIAKHGFSYRWREESLEGEGKRIVLRISGHGHAEENFFDVPLIEGTKQMNPIQVAGAMSTYGRRYTFIAGFGIIIEDEDSDAQELSFEHGVKYADYVGPIEQETDVEAARETAKNYYQELKQLGDHEGAQVVMQVFNRRKAEIEGKK